MLSKRSLPLTIISLTIIVGIFAIYFFLTHTPAPTTPPNNTPPVTDNNAVTESKNHPGWLTYTNTKYKFSFDFPQYLLYKDQILDPNTDHINLSGIIVNIQNRYSEDRSINYFKRFENMATKDINNKTFRYGVASGQYAEISSYSTTHDDIIIDFTLQISTEKEQIFTEKEQEEIVGSLTLLE